MVCGTFHPLRAKYDNYGLDADDLYGFDKPIPFLTEMGENHCKIYYYFFYPHSDQGPLHVGEICIEATDNDLASYKFIDYLCVDYENHSQHNRFGNSKIFLPFVNTDHLWIKSAEISPPISNMRAVEWLIDLSENELPLPVSIEREIKGHFKLCDGFSRANQSSINYDIDKHLKFALMDHMLRGSIGNMNRLPNWLPGNRYSIHYEIYFNNKIEVNEYLYAYNELVKDSLIPTGEHFEGINRYRIVKIGQITKNYGLEKAKDFNKKQEKEKFEEQRREDTRDYAAKSVKVSTWAIWLGIGSIMATLFGVLVSNWIHHDNNPSTFEEILQNQDTQRMQHYLDMKELERRQQLELIHPQNTLPFRNPE